MWNVRGLLRRRRSLTAARLRSGGVNPEGVRLRAATAADYDQIIAVVDDWWGRPIGHALARVFLDHFYATSTIAESGTAESGTAESGTEENKGGELAGFLIGFLSPSQPDAAYIHFVGVHPSLRGAGLARTLYERFFALAREHGRRVVSAITAPQNTGSIAFHTAMGFTVTPPIPDYDGEGSAKVLFQCRL
jgi:ribosomal protein S18 acetylase RimI-like enzyme